jgi:hypothetical protein
MVVPVFLQCRSTLRGLVYRVGIAERVHISLSGLVAWGSLTMIGFPLLPSFYECGAFEIVCIMTVSRDIFWAILVKILVFPNPTSHKTQYTC